MNDFDFDTFLVEMDFDTPITMGTPRGMAQTGSHKMARVLNRLTEDPAQVAMGIFVDGLIGLLSVGMMESNLPPSEVGRKIAAQVIKFGDACTDIRDDGDFDDG